MLKIIGYRIINGHTVTHLTRARKFKKNMEQVKKFEYNTACRYMLKDETFCECWAIIEHR